MPMNVTATVRCDFPGCAADEIAYQTLKVGDEIRNPLGWKTFALYEEGSDQEKPSSDGVFCPEHVAFFEQALVR